MGDPSLVVASGDQDAWEDFIQEAAEQDWERDYMKPTRQVENKESNKKKDGFMVSKAPWDVSSAEAFPSPARRLPRTGFSPLRPLSHPRTPRPQSTHPWTVQ